MAKSIYYFVTLGCMCMVTTVYAQAESINLTVGGLSVRGFHNVSEPVTGECEAFDINGNPATLPTSVNRATFRVANGSTTCALRIPIPKIESLPNTTVSITATNLSFIIKVPELRVYTIWCEIDYNKVAYLALCRSAAMYDLEITKTDSGFDCELNFGFEISDNFQRPDKVEWLRNGQPLDPAVSSSLDKTDFADIRPGDYPLKSYSFPLEIASDEIISGVYECKFSVEKQTLSSKYTVELAPKGQDIQVEPDLEQHKDGQSVYLSCEFHGYPEPDILWHFNGGLVNLTATKTTKKGLTISTINIEAVESAKDRGNYSCIGNNSLGADERWKVLHVRTKLAALWPFLGILVQVILLAICIIVGEKCRKKRYAEKQRKRQLGDEDDNATRT